MSGLRRAALATSLLSLIAGAATVASAADRDEEKWETHVVADKPQAVTIDPAKAYILVHSPYIVMPTFMRMPSAEDAARNAQRRAEALSKERASWQRKFTAWEAEMKRLEHSPASITRPKRPVEPTETNFKYPEYEQVHPVTLGPQNRFAKVDGSTYLQEVPPGDYVFYGLMNICACLGTVSFEAPAGKVVAVEFSMPFLDAAMSLPKEQRPKSVFALGSGMSSLRIGVAQVTDSRFPAGSVIAPSFKPAGRRPNWSGIETDRVMAIEGVFRYERDKQIDLRTPVGEPLHATVMPTAEVPVVSAVTQ